MSPSAFIVCNAKIHTVDPETPFATAMGIQNGRFLAVGSSARVQEFLPDVPRVDAKGRTIVPGLIDAHAHLHELGHALRRVDLTDTSSVDEVVKQLQSFINERDLPPETWLRGHGWDETDWSPSHFPTRTSLDTAFPRRPVWLTRTDVHAGWANTAALKASVGLDRLRRMDDPDGGRIHRTNEGEPTGVLLDRAMTLVEDQIPPPPPSHEDRALRSALEHTARHGVTGLHDAGVDLDQIRRFRRFIDEESFPLRVYSMINGRGDTFDHFSKRGPFHDPSGRLQVASTKFFADGALGSRGAALLDDYTDDPGNRGLLRQSEESLRENVQAAVECGFQVNTHAIGDRANRVVLDAYEAARDACSTPPRRPRIEHAQVLTPADLRRFQSLGVIASVQPAHASSDKDWVTDRLGPERVEGAYAWNQLKATGATLAFGSDAPIEPLDPLQGVHAAVTPQHTPGQPDGPPLSEALSRAAALRAYTLDAAFAAFREDEVGSISPGKRADFVVLSRDLMDVPPSHILDTNVVATYLDGHCIHTTPSWPDP